MRPLGVAFRTPIGWERKGRNTGDGDTFASSVIVFGNVKAPRRLRRDAQGSTITDPIVLEVPHDCPIRLGDRVTVDGEDGIVEGREVVRGAFGVPHHVEVRAL